MASSDGIHSLSRLQEEFFFIVAKLHIYDYDDYQFCRFQSKLSKILPELSEDDFLALRACELYGTYDDWVTYHSWVSIQPGIPADVRDEEVDRSFQKYNPNLISEEEAITAFAGNMDDIEALIACMLYGTAEDWEYYLAWTSNPKALHDDIREKEVSMAFLESNPNLFDLEDDDIPEMDDFYGSDECGYQKDRTKRATRLENHRIKDQERICKTCAILEAKASKQRRSPQYKMLKEGSIYLQALLEQGAPQWEVENLANFLSQLANKLQPYQIVVVPGEDEDGYTFVKKAVLTKSSLEEKFHIYSSKRIVKDRKNKSDKQKVAWRWRRFHRAYGDVGSTEIVRVYTLTPIYIDAQMSERYRNASRGGSLRRKVLYPTKFRLKTASAHVSHMHQASPRIFIHGGPGLPGI